MSEVCRNCGTNEGIGCKEHSVTHSNANEGRTPILPKGLKRCGRCHKAWKNCTCEGIPAPADASQGDAPPENDIADIVKGCLPYFVSEDKDEYYYFAKPDDIKMLVAKLALWVTRRDSLRSERGGQWVGTEVSPKWIRDIVEEYCLRNGRIACYKEISKAQFGFNELLVVCAFVVAALNDPILMPAPPASGKEGE